MIIGLFHKKLNQGGSRKYLFERESLEFSGLSL